MNVLPLKGEKYNYVPSYSDPYRHPATDDPIGVHLRMVQFFGPLDGFLQAFNEAVEPNTMELS